eukprot:scaffold17838_cov28-Tisochrysis_lutea.AAC.1
MACYNILQWVARRGNLKALNQQGRNHEDRGILLFKGERGQGGGSQTGVLGNAGWRGQWVAVAGGHRQAAATSCILIQQLEHLTHLLDLLWL